MQYGSGQYHIFTSANLLEWKDEHNPIPKSFECPDFFQLPIDGDKSQMKWVLIQGNGKYSIGTFDGKKFTEETDRRACDIGDFYATQSWHNTDTGDGRRIQAAWMRFSHFPEMPFSQQITFPCELSLHGTADGLRIYRNPIKEIETLHLLPDEWRDKSLRAGRTLPLEPGGRQFHIKAEVEVPMGSKLTFQIRGVPVTFDVNSVTSGKRSASAIRMVSKIEMLVDTASIETFVNDGEVSFTQFVLPHENGISVKAEGGPATIKSLTVWPLRSAWDRAK
jgi:levanase/fructan beta-fructosidase